MGSDTFHTILQEIDRDLRKFDPPFGDISGVASVSSKADLHPNSMLSSDDVAGIVGKGKASSGFNDPIHLAHLNSLGGLELVGLPHLAVVVNEQSVCRPSL